MREYLDYLFDIIGPGAGGSGGGGGGGSDATPYSPVTGYVIAETDGTTNPLDDYIDDFETKPTMGTQCQIKLMPTAPATGDKVLITGTAKDTDETLLQFAMWGEVYDYDAYSTYAQIRLQTFEGISYIAHDGSVQTKFRKAAVCASPDGDKIEPTDFIDTLTSLSVTANGTYTPQQAGEAFGSVDVNVQPNVTSLNVTANGDYTPGASDTYYDAVHVNVQPNLETLTVTANGTYTPGTIETYFNEVHVNVPSSGAELTPYQPKSTEGYTVIQDTQTVSKNNITTLANAFKSNSRGTYVNCNYVTPSPKKREKVCVVGTAADGIPYCWWGENSYYYNNYTYGQISVWQHHGLSYVQGDKVITLVRKQAETEDTEGSGITVYTSVNEYPYYPLSGYTEKVLSNNISKANAERYWESKDTTATYSLESGSTAAVGEHVRITGYLSDQDNTMDYAPFVMWGIVGSVSGTTIKLSEYHGFSYTRKNNTTGSLEGNTYINNGGKYQTDGGQSITVQDALGDFLRGTQVIYEDTTITSVRDYACYGAKSATLELPAVQTAGRSAFAYMENCHIDLPKLATGKDSLFYKSTGITQLKLPELVAVQTSDGSSNAGQYAFANMTDLQYIYLPKLNWCGQYSFANNPALKRIELGAVGMIWDKCFQNSPNLTEIIISGTYTAGSPPTLRVDGFSGAASGAKVYVPDDMVSAFQSATNWSSVASRIHAISELTNYTPGEYTPV